MNLTEDEVRLVKLMAVCDMNVTEVARRMHFHRNTLIYRIQKIEKKTGCDIRKFYDLYDVLFTVAAEAIGVPLGAIMATNIAKLKKRYPDGFSEERSINRE